MGVRHMSVFESGGLGAQPTDPLASLQAAASLCSCAERFVIRTVHIIYYAFTINVVADVLEAEFLIFENCVLRLRFEISVYSDRHWSTGPKTHELGSGLVS